LVPRTTKTNPMGIEIKASSERAISIAETA
jgi:hypothetical protein